MSDICNECRKPRSVLLNVTCVNVPCDFCHGDCTQPDLEGRSECKHGTLSSEPCERCENEWMHKKLGADGWKPQPTAPTSVDLTALIEWIGRETGYDDESFVFDCLQRDEIVLALRVLRVGRHDAVTGVFFKQSGEIIVLFTKEGYIPLDEAERILGLTNGGEK